MCSQTVAETSKFTNIWKRFWTPLQIDCGMLVDTGEKDEKGQPILEAKYGFHASARRGLFIQYLKWTPKRLQTVMGHSSVSNDLRSLRHVDDIEADKADMAKIEAAVRAA